MNDYLKRGRPTPEREFEDCLFLSSTGKPVSRSNLWAMVKKAPFRAGIEKNVHPHLFRHTMATKMAEQGCNAFEIQAQTRHKHIETVQKYVHISEAARRVAYERTFASEKPPRAHLSSPGSYQAPLQPLVLSCTLRAIHSRRCT